MNPRTSAILPGLLLLAACAPESALRPTLAGCKQLPETACSGGSQVNLNLNAAGGPSVAPECIKVEPGDSFDIKITPAPAAPGGVVTIPDDVGDWWLVAGNGNAGGVDRIRITVPTNATLGKFHKYLILSNDGSGGQCLDPRVHVDR